MEVPNNYKRLESCSKEELIEKIIVRDRHCNDLKRLLDKGLKKYKELEEENRNLKESLDIATKCSSKEEDGIIRLSEENKKLKEFKAKQEEMMFLIGASIELAEPKTYKDAEKLQKGKEIYEKLYKKELYSLRKENELLKECNIRNYTSKSNTDDMNLKLLEENKKLEEKYEKLKADYIKLSKIVEINGGYRASYVNELRDKIAKLEYMRKTDAEYIKRLQS